MRLLGFLKSPAPLLRHDGVLLRLATAEDYESWAKLRCDSFEFLQPWEPLWPPHELSRSAFAARLRRQKRDVQNGEAYPFLIFRQGDATLLGGITIGNIRGGVAQAATIGYWIGAPFARQGYMTRGMRTILEFGFSTMRLHRLEAACLPSNAASIALLEKNGFQREGLARAYLQIDGEWRDHYLYGQLEGDRDHSEKSAPSPND